MSNSLLPLRVTNLWLVGLLLVVGGLLAAFARKAGKDAVNAEQGREVLKDLQTGAKPVDATELNSVREKYRRD